MPSAAPLYAQLGTFGMKARMASKAVAATSSLPKYLTEEDICYDDSLEALLTVIAISPY